MRERDEVLLRAILCGGAWNGFLLGQARKEDVPCRFCGKRDGDGHLFWECTFLPLLHVRELLEFASLMSMDRSEWPRYLLWHGWLPGLSSTGGSNPWAASFGQVACFELERGQGAYPVDESAFWTPPDHWDADGIALEMTDAPNNWTDGSREVCFLPLVGLRLLALVFICLPRKLPLKVLSGEWMKSMVMLVWSVAVLSCLSLDPSRLLSVLNFGCAIIALRLYSPCHLGIDNLSVCSVYWASVRSLVLI